MDLSRGESLKVTLSDGHAVNVRLIAASVTKDSIRGSVRSAQVDVEIDGRRIALEAANIICRSQSSRCPVTGTVNANTDHMGA